MKSTNFENSLVQKISDFLQNHMKDNELNSLTADQCAQLLSEDNILSNKIGPKPGFNFRQMLRDGRDGKIDFVIGASQKRPNTKWIIKKI